jgi:signal transduction histidine kinase
MPAGIVSIMVAFGTFMPARAGTDFGTDEQVRALVAQFIAFTKDKGTDAAVAALKDKASPFGAAGPGLMIWVDNKMAAHNKYPDLSGVDFATMQDLRGHFVIKEFTEAADKGGDYSLNYWPAYGGEKEYEYHCFSAWIEKPRVMTTACR